jgi:hypothetical protein
MAPLIITYPCNFCSLIFEHSDDLDDHRRSAPNHWKHPCSFCGLNFSRKQTKETHERKCPYQVRFQDFIHFILFILLFQQVIEEFLEEEVVEEFLEASFAQTLWNFSANRFWLTLCFFSLFSLRLSRSPNNWFLLRRLLPNLRLITTLYKKKTTRTTTRRRRVKKLRLCRIW